MRGLLICALLLPAPSLFALDLPFRRTPGQIEVQASVNGRPPLWFVVDTGAEYSILDPKSRSRTASRRRLSGSAANSPTTSRWRSEP